MAASRLSQEPGYWSSDPTPSSREQSHHSALYARSMSCPSFTEVTSQLSVCDVRSVLHRLDLVHVANLLLEGLVLDVKARFSVPLLHLRGGSSSLRVTSFLQQERHQQAFRGRLAVSCSSSGSFASFTIADIMSSAMLLLHVSCSSFLSPCGWVCSFFSTRVLGSLSLAVCFLGSWVPSPWYPFFVSFCNYSFVPAVANELGTAPRLRAPSFLPGVHPASSAPVSDADAAAAAAFSPSPRA